jgi:hypothetical protein
MNPVLMNQGIGTGVSNVDTITVELRSITGTLVNSATALLHTNGSAAATFLNTPIGSYYIVIKHRNAVETWSAIPQVVNGGELLYDFTNSITKAYGNNLKLLEPNVYGLYSGDLNQDGYVDIFDFPLYDTANQSGGVADGTYIVTDMNGDGYIDIFDFPLYDSNNQNNVQVISPN